MRFSDLGIASLLKLKHTTVPTTSWDFWTILGMAITLYKLCQRFSPIWALFPPISARGYSLGLRFLVLTKDRASPHADLVWHSWG